jgi:hypothetical protein
MFLKFEIIFFCFCFFKKLAIALEGNDFFEIFCLCHQENFEKNIFKIVIPPEGNEKNK